MGIRPWEVDLLTVEQFTQAVADIDAYIAAHKQAQPQQGAT